MPSFQKLSENLERLAGLSSRITKPVAEGINSLIKTQFSTGQDPYGKAWAPLLPSTVRRKKGDNRVLLRSDRLSIETVAKATSGSGISIVSVDYGSFHQSGTVHMGSRQILPARSDLPVSWQNLIRAELSKAFGG
jgi:phage gpG-like protein